MYRVGVDIGGTNIAFGITDDNGTMLFQDSFPANPKQTDEEITISIIRFVLDMIQAKGITEEEVRSIGIGCPGACDRKESILRYTVNLPFRNTNFREIFGRYTKIPVYLANDADCAALGEMVAGGAKGYQTSLTITLGTGVGGGIIIDGKIFSGFNDAGGELGHMVIRRNGEPCGCGRKGCLEAYASASALIRETKKAMAEHPESCITALCDGDPNRINAKTAFDAKRLGDPVGTALVQDYIEALGEGLINYINIFQPEMILIGGGVSKEGEYLLAPLREYVYSYTYGNDFLPLTRIERAILGNNAGIIGAAMLG